ncbi:MAG: 3-methyladenine DNA glycosylase, partial [Gemmatimonadetes bacterium]|nr:3-methyladenine DNA glycosylase [Gemmatimonadota bacterium]
RRRRRARGQPHPVHDFLFDYYRYSTAKLLEWHPPIGVFIEDSEAARSRFQTPCYRNHEGRVRRDPATLEPKERGRLSWTLDLLRSTASRPAWLECFGIHEWAMLYRAAPARHEGSLNLRVDPAAIDRLVASSDIVCTHFDAYRFFADEAKPLNRARPSLDARRDLEQPGCVHANMDLYKWAYKSMPWIGSDILADCFHLAVELRELDMRASPYDVSPLGLVPIPVETDEGRQTYADEQLRLAQLAGELRRRLIHALETVLARIP